MSPNSPIKFGTDGWRAIIGQEFTLANVESVIQAFCDWHLAIDPQNRHIILGFDRRNKSPEAAQRAAEVLAGNDFSVELASQFCPTPCVSWMVKDSEAIAGIIITASHNPSEWNGVKFKENYGGSASPEFTAEIEKQISLNEEKKREIQKLSLEEGKQKGLIQFFNPHTQYLDQLKKLVDVEQIQKSSFKILNDPLYGAGTHYLKTVIGDQVSEIHTEADPTFGGLNPEPIDKNLGELMQKVKAGPWQVGLATDGDADRIGAVDEDGTFVNSHQIFALLLKHYIEDKNLKGTVVKSISATEMINILGRKYGLKIIETPVGFKHICKKIVEFDALMGGEESGGISFAPHVHERDGILNGLMLLEMMAVRQKSLKQLIQDLYDEIGTFFFDRFDQHLSRNQIEALQEKLKNETILELAGKKVVKTNFMDGFKYIFEDNSWLLIRASGTEPLIRIYAEAPTNKDVVDLLKEGQRLAGV